MPRINGFSDQSWKPIWVSKTKVPRGGDTVILIMAENNGKIQRRILPG